MPAHSFSTASCGDASPPAAMAWMDHFRDDLRELDDFVDLREPPDFDLPEEDFLVDDFFEEDLDADFLVEDFFAADLREVFFAEAFLVEDFLAEDFFEGDFFEVDLPDEDEDFDFVDFFAPEPLRPLPDFLPPPDCLFTVAQARRSASPFETPRSS